LFVVAISDFLKFSHAEQNSYLLVKRLAYREELRSSAAKVIGSMYHCRVLERHLKNRLSGNPFLDSKSDSIKKHKADFNFRRKMLEFNKKSLEMRQFEDNTELIFLSKNVDNIAEELEEIQKRQEKLKSKQIKTLKLINLLTDSNINPEDFEIETNVSQNEEGKITVEPYKKIDMKSEHNSRNMTMNMGRQTPTLRINSSKPNTLAKSGSFKVKNVEGETPLQKLQLEKIHTYNKK